LEEQGFNPDEYDLDAFLAAVHSSSIRKTASLGDDEFFKAVRRVTGGKARI
jgi:hypothetical protein